MSAKVDSSWDFKPEVRREAAYAVIGDDLDRLKEVFQNNGNKMPAFDDARHGYGSPSYFEWTHLAASNNAVKVLEWLITECGFSGMEPDYECSYPAHHAAKSDAVEALHWLLENVPDCNYYNDNGDFPRTLLSSEGRLRLTELEEAEYNYSEDEEYDCDDDEEEGDERGKDKDEDKDKDKGEEKEDKTKEDVVVSDKTPKDSSSQ